MTHVLEANASHTIILLQNTAVAKMSTKVKEIKDEHKMKITEKDGLCGQYLHKW